MRRSPFTIAAMLGIIALVALGLVVLRDPSRLDGSIAFSTALGTLTLAGGAALYRQGSRRAFWTGFTLCGWLYLAVSLLPPLAPVTRPHLVTTALLTLLEERVLKLAPYPAPLKAPPTNWDLWMGYEERMGELEDVRETMAFKAYLYTPRLVWVGHSMWSLLVATAGGAVFRWLHVTRTE